MPHKVTLIPGDGIGPEVAAAAREAVDATGVKIDWEPVDLNADVIAQTGQSLPQHVVDSLERTLVGLKGPVTTPIAGGYTSVNVALRKRLDLYANVRPVRSLPGLVTRFSDVKIDMVIFRENTEDLYSGLEHEVVRDVVTSLKVITRTASIRIAEAAFSFAAELGRKKVAAIHKANIMKLADGLFLRCCREVAARFPQIEYRELIVDNASMQLVIRPEQFDILLLPNLYGDIVSDLAAGLVGGLGVVPGANLGERHAVFEAVHGSAPDIAGKGIANPTAMMLSAVMMLVHLKEQAAANRLRSAVESVYAERKHLTPNVGGSAGSREFTDAVIGALSKFLSAHHRAILSRFHRNCVFDPAEPRAQGSYLFFAQSCRASLHGPLSLREQDAPLRRIGRRCRDIVQRAQHPQANGYVALGIHPNLFEGGIHQVIEVDPRHAHPEHTRRVIVRRRERLTGNEADQDAAQLIDGADGRGRIVHRG